MKIARWKVSGRLEEGFVINERVVPFPDRIMVADALRLGLAGTRALFERVSGEDGVPLAQVDLLAPIVPASIRDFAAFEEHVEGMTADAEGAGRVPAEWYKAPTFYFTNPHTVLGPFQEVVPPQTDLLDFELEVAAVIGAAEGVGETNLTLAEGEAVIFGYTIMNDWSARDLQAREMEVRLGPVKGKDFGTTLGPWIVTADEMAPYVDDEGFLALRAEARVNDEVVGEDLISNMGWPFGALVAYASRASRVVPGDVLGSGTTGNGGCLGELWGRRGVQIPPPLQEGECVLLMVEGLGEIAGRVGRAVEAPAIPPARRRPRRRHRG